MRKLPFGVVLTPAQIAYYEELLQLIRELRARERELRAIRDASSCVALLNAARQFLVSGPALHGVQIEGGKVTRDELASLISAALGEHRAAGKRAVEAMAGMTFGANPDRLELEDLPTSDPLCVRCADQEPGSPPLPTECTCGKTVTSDTIAADCCEPFRSPSTS
jgi:hypothetical protein